MPEQTAGPAGPCIGADMLAQLAAGATAGAGELEHLRRCPDCARSLESLCSDAALLGGARRAQPSEPATDSRAEPGDSATGGLDAIPGYSIVGVIGRGGQATVYEALQTSTRRRVALKVLHGGAFAPQALQRFEREIEMASRLRHPHIVTIFDSGATPGGQPYLAMERIDGQPLDPAVFTAVAHGAPQRASPREIVARFLPIVAAIQYAHRRGVIHRDLSLGNILIDGEGQPRIVDFGMARPTELAGRTRLTVPGGFAGTLAYAAPEQVSGATDAIDTRSDVYALGVILYLLLAGVRPYAVDGPIEEIFRRIRDEVPPPPSRHRPAIDGELDTIVLKALAKEPGRRYDSAGLLADLQRYLAGEAIEAKRDSAWYMLRKGLQRHRALATGLLLGGLLLLSFSLLTLRQAHRARLAESAARAQAAVLARTASENIVERGLTLALSGNVYAGEELIWREVFFAAVDNPRYALWALRGLYFRYPCCANRTIPEAVGLVSLCATPNGGLARVETRSGGWELLEWSLLPSRRFRPADSAAARDVRSETAQADPAAASSVRPVPVSFDQIELYPLLREPRPDVLARVFAILPRVNRLLSFDDGTSFSHDWSESGWGGRATRLAAGPAGSSPPVVAVSADEQFVAVAGPECEVLVFESRTGILIARLAGSTAVTALAFAHQEPRLAIGYAPARVEIWDFQQGVCRAGIHHAADSSVPSRSLSALRFSPDDSSLFVFRDFNVIAWRLIDGTSFADLWPVTPSMAFTPDSRRFAIAYLDGAVQTWEQATGRPLRRWRVYRTAPLLLEYSADGDTLISGSEDGWLRAWRTGTSPALRELPVECATIHSVRFSADGKLLAAGGAIPSSERIWDLSSGRAVHHVDTCFDSQVVAGIALDRAGKTLVSVSHDGSLRIVPLSDSAGAIRLTPPGAVKFCHVEFGRNDDELLVAGEPPEALFTWPLRESRGQRRFGTWRGRVARARYSPDYRWVAAGETVREQEQGRDLWRLRLYDAETTELSWETPAHLGPIRDVLFTQDGRRLISAGDDSVLRVWDVATGAPLADLPGHSGAVFCLALHPNGRILASGSRSGELRIWDIEQFRPLCAFDGLIESVFDLAFRPPGGHELAVAGTQTTTRTGTLSIIDFTELDHLVIENLAAWQAQLVGPPGAPHLEGLLEWAESVRNRLPSSAVR